jgi:hypothetical protein
MGKCAPLSVERVHVGSALRTDLPTLQKTVRSADPTNAGLTPSPTMAWERSNPRDTVLGIALASLFLQMLLYAVIRVPPMISYYFGPFPITVLFGWAGIEAFARLRLRGAVIVIYGLCVGILTVAGLWHVHQFGWPRSFVSPALGNQVEVVRALNRYSDDSVMTTVSVYQNYPQALSTLRVLLPPEPGAVQSHSGRLLVRYRTEEGAADGRIELVEVRPAEMPADAKPVTLSATK